LFSYEVTMSILKLTQHIIANEQKWFLKTGQYDK